MQVLIPLTTIKNCCYELKGTETKVDCDTVGENVDYKDYEVRVNEIA